jgi:purine nucleoside phosphorylase
VVQADVGVFGGSGFYSFLEDVDEVEIETPYGKPSAPLTVGEIGGKRVAFLPRHGLNHELPPHEIPYRANVWAMKELGVRRLIGPNASGALKADLELGEFVVCDQFVDRTSGRADTFTTAPRPPTSPLPTPTVPTSGGSSSKPPASSASGPGTAERSSSSRARASRPGPSRGGSRRWAGTRST